MLPSVNQHGEGFNGSFNSGLDMNSFDQFSKSLSRSPVLAREYKNKQDISAMNGLQVSDGAGDFSSEGRVLLQVFRGNMQNMEKEHLTQCARTNDVLKVAQLLCSILNPFWQFPRHLEGVIRLYAACLLIFILGEVSVFLQRPFLQPLFF